MGTVTTAPSKEKSEEYEERKKAVLLKKSLRDIEKAYKHLSGDDKARERSMIFLGKRFVDGENAEKTKIRGYLVELLHNDPVTCNNIMEIAKKYKGNGKIPNKSAKILPYKKYDTEGVRKW
ncbi:MAG: hypothetical protein KGI06_01075 [Candidatus Micrarchaeota archaeon]|nr:hypothetical protein [Candidatus Micrarchaeota archaeon]